MPKRTSQPITSEKKGSEGPKRGRPVGDHEANRAKLLDATRSVIAKEGFSNASLRNVAKYAGATTGAVTYYFSNREELIVAFAESRFDHYDAMLEAVRPTGNIKALFESWLDLAVGDPDFSPVMSELIAHGRQEPALTSIIAKRYARYRRIYATIITEGQKHGTIRDDIPANLLVDHLCAMGDGWALMVPIEPKRFSKRRLRTLIDSAITLISPPAAGR